MGLIDCRGWYICVTRHRPERNWQCRGFSDLLGSGSYHRDSRSFCLAGARAIAAKVQLA